MPSTLPRSSRPSTQGRSSSSTACWPLATGRGTPPRPGLHRFVRRLGLAFLPRSSRSSGTPSSNPHGRLTTRADRALPAARTSSRLVALWTAGCRPLVPRRTCLLHHLALRALPQQPSRQGIRDLTPLLLVTPVRLWLSRHGPLTPWASPPPMTLGHAGGHRGAHGWLHLRSRGSAASRLPCRRPHARATARPLQTASTTGATHSSTCPFTGSISQGRRQSWWNDTASATSTTSRSADAQAWRSTPTPCSSSVMPMVWDALPRRLRGSEVAQSRSSVAPPCRFGRAAPRLVLVDAAAAFPRSAPGSLAHAALLLRPRAPPAVPGSFPPACTWPAARALVLDAARSRPCSLCATSDAVACGVAAVPPTSSLRFTLCHVGRGGLVPVRSCACCSVRSLRRGFEPCCCHAVASRMQAGFFLPRSPVG